MSFTRMLLLVSVVALVLVPVAAAIGFTDASFQTPIGVTGQAYYHKLEIRAGGGTPPYTYVLLAGALPTGLKLEPSTGEITGIPTVPGDFSFWVDGKDCGTPCGFPQESTQREFTIKVILGLQIVQRQSTLTPGMLNTPYSLQFTTTGGGSPTWSVSGALPAGIGLNASSGLLSGTPTATGDYTFKIKATDGGRSDTQSYTLSVVQQLKVTSLAAPAAEVGQPFAMTLTATGGKPGYTWSLASGASLPAGLTLDSVKGAITGQPTAAGPTTVQLTVTDSLKLTSTVNLKIGVAAPLAIIKRALPAAKAGHAYRARVWTRGGVAPKSWTIVGGSLPAGIHLNARTGALTGAAKHAGRSRVTIEVSDKLGVVSKVTFVLKVVA